LPTRTIASAERYLTGPSAGEAICVVIDLPGEEGLRALETLRHHGVLAPAILVADADAGLPPEALSDCGALDVLERPADKRALLG
jgi:FixJ family two-component response regulator